MAIYRCYFILVCNLFSNLHRSWRIARTEIITQKNDGYLTFRYPSNNTPLKILLLKFLDHIFYSPITILHKTFLRQGVRSFLIENCITFGFLVIWCDILALNSHIAFYSFVFPRSFYIFTLSL